jgi:hypothetical protein
MSNFLRGTPGVCRFCGIAAALWLALGQTAAYADFVPFADQIATNFYSLQLRGISFESEGQLAEVYVAEGTMDPASFGHIRITDLSANSILFEQTYGDLGGICCSPQIRGSFAQQLVLPYATPLQIDMNGQEFSGMSVLYGNTVVASGRTFDNQFPSFSTSLTINTNVPPTATDDSVAIPRDQATAIGVLNNDGGAQLQLAGVSAPPRHRGRKQRGGDLYPRRGIRGYGFVRLYGYQPGRKRQRNRDDHGQPTAAQRLQSQNQHHDRAAGNDHGGGK